MAEGGYGEAGEVNRRGMNINGSHYLLFLDIMQGNLKAERGVSHGLCKAVGNEKTTGRTVVGRISLHCTGVG